MKTCLYLILILCLSSTLVLPGDLQLLFPSSKNKISHSQGGFFKALYTSSEMTEFQLLQNARLTASMNIATEEAKVQFPNILVDLFSNKFNVNILVLDFIDMNGDTTSFKYNFSTTRPLDLEDFWKTTDFRRALQKVQDIDGISLNITLIGWKAEKRILNPFNRRNHLDLIGSPLTFTPGENQFFLQFRNSSFELIFSDTLHYYYNVPGLAEDVPEDAVENPFHGQEEEKCTYCHVELEEDDCSFCHASILSMDIMHPPAEEMECNTCHDDESDQKHELLEDFRQDPGACMICHSDQEDEVDGMENVHPPMDETCLSCHDPHGTPYDHLLVLKTNEVCLSCHDHVEKGVHPVKKHPHSGYPNPLNPSVEFSCASCHHPHASDEEYLLRGSWSELCQQCHFKN